MKKSPCTVTTLLCKRRLRRLQLSLQAVVYSRPDSHHFAAIYQRETDNYWPDISSYRGWYDGAGTRVTCWRTWWSCYAHIRLQPSSAYYHSPKAEIRLYALRTKLKRRDEAAQAALCDARTPCSCCKNSAGMLTLHTLLILSIADLLKPRSKRLRALLAVLSSSCRL